MTFLNLSSFFRIYQRLFGLIGDISDILELIDIDMVIESTRNIIDIEIKTLIAQPYYTNSSLHYQAAVALCSQIRLFQPLRGLPSANYDS